MRTALPLALFLAAQTLSTQQTPSAQATTAADAAQRDTSFIDANGTAHVTRIVPVPASLQLSHAEVRAPWFSRRFTVSEDFDTSRIEAALKDGVLKLTVPAQKVGLAKTPY